jgi:hypothetical protein
VEARVCAREDVTGHERFPQVTDPNHKRTHTHKQTYKQTHKLVLTLNYDTIELPSALLTLPRPVGPLDDNTM